MIKQILLLLLLCTISVQACSDCDDGPLDIKREDVEILVKASEKALENWSSLSLTAQQQRINIIVQNIKVLLKAPKEAWTQDLINRAYIVTKFVDEWQQAQTDKSSFFSEKQYMLWSLLKTYSTRLCTLYSHYEKQYN